MDDSVGRTSNVTEPNRASVSANGQRSGLQRITHRLSPILRVGVSLVLLYVLLSQIGLGDTLATLRSGDAGLLIAAFLLYQLGVVLRAYRWQVLLQALGARLGLARLTVLYYVGTFFSNFLPSGVGGDVIRAYELTRDGPSAVAAASTVIVDRATGLLMLLAMALVALAFSYQLLDPQVVGVIAVVCGGTFVGLGVVIIADRWLQAPGRRASHRWPPAGWIWRLVDRVTGTKFYQSFREYGRSALSQALGLSVVFNVLLIVTNVLLAWAFGVRVSLWYFFLFIPIISFSLLLPISLSGLGVREGAFVVLFGQAGVPANLALAMSLAFYGVNLATGLIGGVLYAIPTTARRSSELQRTTDHGRRTGG
jgi:uncharacterized protein (TIRG00374 family)